MKPSVHSVCNRKSQFTMTDTLYVIYNADGSVLGKLQYGYKKLTWNKSQQDTPCAACDITHGGLSLNPTQSWIDTKKKIEDSRPGLQVKELHRDEVPAEVSVPLEIYNFFSFVKYGFNFCFTSIKVSDYLKKNEVSLPVAMMKPTNGDFRVVIDKTALNGCNGDAAKFLELLKADGAITLEQ